MRTIGQGEDKQAEVTHSIQFGWPKLGELELFADPALDLKSESAGIFQAFARHAVGREAHDDIPHESSRQSE